MFRVLLIALCSFSLICAMRVMFIVTLVECWLGLHYTRFIRLLSLLFNGCTVNRREQAKSLPLAGEGVRRGTKMESMNKSIRA